MDPATVQVAWEVSSASPKREPSCGKKDTSSSFPIPVKVLQLPVRDREPLPPELLRRGVDFVREQRRSGKQILVACGAGISRSPTFVAAYLHEEGMDLLTAFQAVLARRPNARPHRHLVGALLDYYDIPGDRAVFLNGLIRGEAPPTVVRPEDGSCYDPYEEG